MNKPLALIASVAALAAVPGVASAATMVTSSTFPAAATDRSYATGNSHTPGWYAGRHTITGLQKFDPSLGTLTGVALSTSFDYSYDLTLQAGDVTDPAQPHEAVADFYSFTFLVAYRPATTTYSIASEDHPVGALTAAGGVGEPPASNSISGSGTVSVVLKDFTSSVDLADFIGTGDVTSLIVASHLPYSADFTSLTNLDGATGEATTHRAAGAVSLRYTYVIPEPSGVALLGLVGLATLARRGRPES